MRRFHSLLIALGGFALAACDKNAVQDITGPLDASRVKFFHFGVNAPGVNFYANDAKLTAVLSATGAEATTGTVYGGAGSGGFYSAIAPGQYTFTGKIAAATDKDLVISSISATLESGKSYSVYLSGFYDAATKRVEGFAVEDAYAPTIDYANAVVRFVNAISNAGPMTLYAKLQSTGLETAIGAAVAYKGAGAFATIPPGVYDLATRTGGSSTNAIALTGVSFVAGRVYTVGARGDITVTSTTAATRPILSSTANR